MTAAQPEITTAELVALLKSRRLPTTSEAAMHDSIAALLDANSITYLHELRLDKHNRLDFGVRTEPPYDRWTAIEVKLRQGSDKATMRQIIRYALTGQVAAIVLIVGRHFAFKGDYLEGPQNRKIPLHIITPTL